jgi:general secretion pathway protein J
MNRRGFTMLELMVSVGILAMVSSLVYGALSATLSSQYVVMSTQERYHAGRVAMTKMTRDLTNAFISKHVSVMEKNRETLFIGKDNKVMFTYLGHYRWDTESPESDQGVVEYYLKSSSEGKKLIRREKIIIDDSPDKGGTEEVLATGVKELEIEYYDKEAEDWVDDWKAELDDTEPIFLDKSAEKAHELGKKLTGMDELEEFMLPTRVRVRLILVDEEGDEYPFESVAEIRLTDAFNW